MIDWIPAIDKMILKICISSQRTQATHLPTRIDISNFSAIVKKKFIYPSRRTGIRVLPDLPGIYGH